MKERPLACAVLLLPAALAAPLLAGDAAPPPVLASRSGDIAVSLSPRGEVTGIAFRGTGGPQRDVRMRTIIQGCEEKGEVVSRAVDGGGVEFERPLSQGKSSSRCVLRERFTPAESSIRWEVEVRGEGDPWSAPIASEISWPRPEKARFWTAWGDPRPAPANEWVDPLVPVRFLDREFLYGVFGDHSKNFCLPLATVLEEEGDLGLSLVQSPEDAILDLRLAAASSGTLRLSRENHRISSRSPVRFAMDLVAHPADFRPGLRWMAKRYPSFFDPPNPEVDLIAGCGAYSTHEGPLDAWKLHRMAFRLNWKASYDFPHMGMFLPPVPEGEEWTNFRGEKTSVPRLREYSERMGSLGFRVLNYFNVTEYGAFYKYPPPPRKAASDGDLWKDANDFLFYRLSEAILPGPDGKPIGSWEGCVAMDPGEPVYREFLIEQARRHVKELPASAGICIDRLDWCSLYNSRRDDGLSWVKGKPARFLAVSWKEAMAEIGPVFHRARKVIFVNPLIQRLDMLRDIDGIYDEAGGDLSHLNMNAVLGLRRPTLGWTGTSAELGPDADAYFQRLLYLGVFPTVPYPANDHTINPDARAERCYQDYGPLLAVLRGRKWVLGARPVEVQGGGRARANLFEVPGGIAAPVVMGGGAASARVVLRDPPIEAGAKAFRIDALHPGSDRPVTVAFGLEQGAMTLDVPLSRGCAMVRLSRLWTEPEAGCFLDPLAVEVKTAVPGADVRVRVLEGDGFGAPGDEWAPYRGPLRLERTATVVAAVFREGRQEGSSLIAAFHRLPLPVPAIEPARAIFEESISVSMSIPAAARGAVIRYTLDGTSPTASSPLYAGPIRVEKDVLVEARAFRAGGEPGEAARASFRKVPPVPPPPQVHLSALTPIRATVGWGEKVRVDRSIQDRTLSVAGREHSKGLGAHARSELVYEIPKEYKRFVSVVGVDDEMKGYREIASITFSVLVDGKPIAESPVLRVGDRWHFDVAIPAGARRIHLLAGDAGDGINADHADWVEAGFVSR